MKKRMIYTVAAVALCVAGLVAFWKWPRQQQTTLADMPEDYRTAADWIWENRIVVEDSLGSSCGRWNSIFDQIIAGEGTLHYVVRWQSCKPITYDQRQQLARTLTQCIHQWTDWLSGYDGWPYDHVEVKIVGWAVLDPACLLDLQEDEVVYTESEPYDAQFDAPEGWEAIPNRLPLAPAALSRFEHFQETGYQYPGGLSQRFDMYAWATEGLPELSGFGGDWGQQLSDSAYLEMLDGVNLHVFLHEVGHGFGMTDFYGGEGEPDGFPPGGFPGGENSIMMAGSSLKITDFDGWMLRYMWSQIRREPGRLHVE